MRLLATLLGSLVIAAALLSPPARAASPYVVDGVALGARFAGGHGYQCSPSEQFPEAIWCRTTRTERGLRGRFSSIASILHTRDGSVAYASRKIRPAFFAANDMETEIKRLSAKFGVPAREIRLPEHDDVARAVIALWGNLQLEELDRKSLSALELESSPRQGLLIDHLGDVAQSIQRGLPVYRLSSGSGYLWSAACDRSGRGHLRFLAVDVAALAAKKDWRLFLSPQFTALVTSEAGKVKLAPTKHQPEHGAVDKARLDAERAKIIEAERIAAEERAKARLAWVRFEEDKAASEARTRVRWTIVVSCFILIAILALLRLMGRREQNAADQCVASGSPDGAERNPGLLSHCMRAAGFAAMIGPWLGHGRGWAQYVRSQVGKSMPTLRAMATCNSRPIQRSLGVMAVLVTAIHVFLGWKAKLGWPEQACPRT